MVLDLTIHYRTNWGEELRVEGNFGKNGESLKLPMTYAGDGWWKIKIVKVRQKEIQYRYLLAVGEHHETPEYRHRHIALNAEKTIVRDEWFSPDAQENIYNRSAFSEAIFNRKTDKKELSNKKVVFQIPVHQVKQGYRLCVSGNIPELGNWDIYKALLLKSSSYPIWEGGINTDKNFEYKFALYSEKQKKIIEWEVGENRKAELEQNANTVLSHAFFRFAHPWKGAGVAIPVFSLRSQQGLGIGEFSDLKLLADFAHKVGMSIVQILPVNDTISRFDWTDSYPYNAISVFALNTIYIHVDDLFKHDKEVLKNIAKEKAELNALKEVDFERVLSLKMHYLQKAYDYYFSSLNDDKDFRNFYTENKKWLEPYAVFCRLRDKYKTTDFSKWKKYSVFSQQIVDEFIDSQSTEYKKTSFYIFIQYHLHLQLKSAVAYLHNLNIALKGDIPIGINRESVDAWTSPDIFKFDQQAGAPPDYFSAVGQNWGFPTYNWEQMQENNYRWWFERFKKMADYFDAYRIDHILGFFRIWEIPFKYNEGLMGHFNPLLPYTQDDLKYSGIPFDSLWWCTPHLFFDEAKALLGKDFEKILRAFFYKENDIYYLKEEFQETRNLSQRCFNIGVTNTEVIEALREVTCDVLFLKDDTGTHFFPRIEVQRTRKFQRLDSHTRERLMSVYYDFFYTRHNEFWKNQALQKLPPILEATNMLVCGEDLGMIPENVPAVMNQLKILTLDIQNMPKTNELEFADPRGFSYLSICTTSTHDTPTLRGMWSYDPSKGSRLISSFSHDLVGIHEDCPGWVCKKILKVNLQAGSVFTIIPLQDWFSFDEALRVNDPHSERINKPEFSRHYWRYRMHLNLEEIGKESNFCDELRIIIKESGR